MIITSLPVILISQGAYPGLYCMKFSSFIHAIIMAAPMLYMYMEFDEKCARKTE